MPARSVYRSILIALWLLTACAPAAFARGDRPRSNEPPLRVLFVGNSYIYSHDMPHIVALVAASRGIEIIPGSLTKPNYAIEDHLATNEYQAKLDEGWDWVILQQGPSSLPANRENLRVWSLRAALMARSRGIKVALMSAWPALPNSHTWIDAELSYHLAGIASQSCVLPVATAWRIAMQADPALRLHDQDELHPVRQGTLLAALVIVRGLTKRPYTPGPAADAMIEDPAWRHAVARAARLDEAATAAIIEETVQCFRAK